MKHKFNCELEVEAKDYEEAVQKIERICEGKGISGTFEEVVEIN